MKKFDEVKVEVEANSTKFQTVISDIETKRIDLQRLELEIDTIKTKSEKHKKVQEDIQREREQLLKQTSTLEGLEKALKGKLDAI